MVPEPQAVDEGFHFMVISGLIEIYIMQVCQVCFKEPKNDHHDFYYCLATLQVVM